MIAKNIFSTMQADRQTRIAIWLIVWTILIAPIGLLYGDGIGAGLGTPVSVGIISMPLSLLVVLYAVFSEPEALLKAIKRPSVIKAFPVGILFSDAVLVLCLILLIPTKTRNMLLRLFDYPKIDSLLWGALSVFLNHGASGVAIKILFLPGTIAKSVFETLFVTYDGPVAGFLCDLGQNLLAVLIAYLFLRTIPNIIRSSGHKKRTKDDE